MNPERQQTLSYAQAPATGLWRWADYSEVIVWHDGTTIAFKAEILEILRWLAPNGLPPLGAVVFLLAACKGKLPNANALLGSSASTDSLPVGYARREIFQATRQQALAQIQSAVSDLQKLHSLPSEVLKPLKAKCVLAEIAFEQAKVERQVDPTAILAGLQKAFSDTELNDGPSQNANEVRHLHMLANGLRHHSADTLLIRLLTGLDAIPEEAEVQLPAFERARRLLEELRQDPEHSMLALAARELMAAVHLPRRLAEHDDLAFGGVADIINRGPLDRLLLSELAHDDLTLAVRVALNEALYLRREPPRHEPPATLALLLDSGLRLWGVPRLLATAVALALAAREKQFSQVLAWRASGKNLTPVNLLKRETLISHLSTLEPQAHCGSALRGFSETISALGEHQSVLVTHPDALADPAFRRALAEAPEAIDFIATVDRTGRFEMRPFPATQRQPLCAADLDLESIFATKSNRVPLLNPQHDPRLPSILGVRPFPFLLPVAGRTDLWTKAKDGKVFLILNDRRLVEFTDERTGCRVLYPALPAGKTFWMEADDNCVYLLKSATSQRPARLVSIARDGARHSVVDLPIGTDLQAVHRQGQALITIQPRLLSAFSLDDGSRLDSISCEPLWWSGRYFKRDQDFFFVSWNGSKVSLQPVIKRNNFPVDETVTLFDREKEEGPWGFLTNGTVVSTVSDEIIHVSQLGAGMPVMKNRTFVSRDGDRIYLIGANPKSAVLADLRTRVAQKRVPAGEPGDVLDPPPMFPTWNVLRVVNGITALPGEGLAISGRKDQWRRIILNQHNRIEIAHCPRIHSGVLSFSIQPVPAELGASLQVAKWPDGSIAWLDSRGLLHLRSRDSSVPEISLVLSDGEVAAWTSDGLMCGPRFFLGDTASSDPVKIFERIKRFMSLL